MLTYTEPFRHWILDEWCEPLPEVSVLSHWEVGYDNDVERGKLTTREIGPAGAVFARLLDPSFVREWAFRIDEPHLVADESLHGGGLQVITPGGWLQIHLDYHRQPHFPTMARRLNLVAFLTPTWAPGDGGDLLLANPSGKAMVEIAPLPGRLVVFETSDLSYYGVRETSRNAYPRITAAVSYLSPAGPGATRQRAMFLPNRNAPGRAPQEVAL